MAIGKFRDAKTFEELINRRHSAGFEKYAIEVDGKKVDKAVFVDTTWETLEEISDAVVYLRFESAKVGSRGLRQEQRRIESMIRTLQQLGDDLFAYRSRMLERVPDLINTGVEL